MSCRYLSAFKPLLLMFMSRLLREFRVSFATRRNLRTQCIARRVRGPLDSAAPGRPLARVPGHRADLALDDRHQREPRADAEEPRRRGREQAAAQHVA